jgi:hypothetical protein
MKFFLLLGGTTGFALAFLGAATAGHEPGIALREGATGCVAGALLLRGLYAVFMHCVRDLAATRARNLSTPEAGE